MNLLHKRSNEERLNTLTHLAGVVFTLATAWFVLIPGYRSGWQQALGVTCFCSGMLLMYAASTLYHWCLPGRAKRWWRKADHISIYVMIAASYSPICIGVVGGATGWTLFGALWAVVALGTVYKLTAIDRWPRLSLLIYLAMGWAFVFVAVPVYTRISTAALCCIGAEGLAYTGGTYFFAHDSRPYYHGVWHVCVLLGSAAHWAAILLILHGA